jgi:hypothetical protein
MAPDGGNNFGGQQAAYLQQAFGFEYAAAGRYLSAASEARVLGQMYNDYDDPTTFQCDPTTTNLRSTSHNRILATGAAQAGTSSSITLAAGDSAANGYYVNNVIAISIAGPFQISGWENWNYSPSYGLVTAYNATTKVATVASWSNGAPTPGMEYNIFATLTISGTAYGATATVTGHNTHFSTDVNVGDAVIGVNGLINNLGPDGFGTPENGQSYVSAITDDTHLTVINNAGVTATSTPSILWYVPQWKTGDCGLISLSKLQLVYPGAPSLLYPKQGGWYANNGSAQQPFYGGNWWGSYGYGHMVLDFQLAPFDFRAVKDLAQIQSFVFDYYVGHYMNYITGPAHSGSSYDEGIILDDARTNAQILAMSIPTFPAMDLTGAWVTQPAIWRMYEPLPDIRYTGDSSTYPYAFWHTRYGTEQSYNPLVASTGPTGAIANDNVFTLAPTSAASTYYRNWLETSMNAKGTGEFSMWGPHSAGQSNIVFGFLWHDPRIASIGYTVQPHQYLFQTSSHATAAALTGEAYPLTERGDAVISRQDWTTLTGSHLYYGSRSYWWDHDANENGTLRLYKVGELLNIDTYYPGSPAQVQYPPETIMGDMMMFDTEANNYSGGTWSGNLQQGDWSGTPTPGSSPIVRWASANHGSWDTAYGDQASKSMLACSDLTGAYTLSLNYALRCIAHFKAPGADEFIMQFDTASPTSPIAITTHVHYPQNGEASSGAAYPKGHTTCPGTGGCGSLNTSRLVQELETGVADGHAADPTPQFGIVTNFLSPGTIAVRWDCPLGGGTGGSDECSATSRYTHGADTGNWQGGHSDRVSVCAGSACDGSVSTGEWLIVHKVAQNLADTSLTTTALNPDSNWTGAQACGATSCAVFIGARGGITHSSMSGFTTNHSGTAQYLFEGLTPGTYAVTINGSAVSGSPFTVAVGDSSIEFENTAGTLSMNGSVAPPAGVASALSGDTTASGNVVIH